MPNSGRNEMISSYKIAAQTVDENEEQARGRFTKLRRKMIMPSRTTIDLTSRAPRCLAFSCWVSMSEVAPGEEAAAEAAAAAGCGWASRLRAWPLRDDRRWTAEAEAD